MQRTFHDLVSRILDSRDAHGDPVNLRRAARSAVWGAEQVVSRHNWSGYQTTLLAELQASVTLTVSVTTAGVATLDSGSLPTWANNGSVLIEDRYHPITQLTATTFQIAGYSAGVISSQSMELSHNRIPLRDDFRRINHVRNEVTQQDLILSDPHSFREREIWNSVSSEPMTVAVFREEVNGLTRQEIRLLPSPSVKTQIRVEYDRAPHAPSLSHDCGLVDIDSSTNTATMENPLSSAAFSHAQSGRMVLLVSADENPPDGDYGFALGVRYEPQQRWDVSDVPNRTEVTLSGTVDNANEQAAILTHVLDIPEGTWEAAAMFAEAKYLQIGEGSIGEFWQTVKMAEEQLRHAMENEAKIRRPETAFPVRGSVYIPPEKIE